MTTSQRISIFKYSVILIGIILVFLLFRRCGNGGSDKPTQDTISVRVDTVWKESKTDTIYVPQTTKTVYRTKYNTDTLESFEYLLLDSNTNAIVDDYYAKRYYTDSISAGYGKVYFDETVTENKISERKVRTSFNLPTIKETVTLREKKRNVFYAGFGAKGSEQSFLEQTEVSFGIRTKNEKMYLLESALSRQGTLLIGGKILIPIRLNKK